MGTPAEWIHIVIIGAIWGLVTYGLRNFVSEQLVRKALVLPRRTFFIDWLDLAEWILGSLLFGMGTVFGIRLVFLPFLFLFVPLFLALSVHVRRIQKAQWAAIPPTAATAVAKQSH